MRKLYVKLIVIALELALAISVVGMSSYAWLTLASNPALEGIQISIGGGNTILVAADVAETDEETGITYHYPARFSDTLNFSQHKRYEYLKNLGELSPVSTADGLNWFLPVYYDVTDQEVVNGSAPAGGLKPVSQFILDDNLTHANLTAEDDVLAAKGSYIYLDFWVTSPGADYTLRVSTATDGTGGSYAIGLPAVEKTADGYALAEDGDNAANSVRIGLLANPDRLMDDATMRAYMKSPVYSEQYTKLRGSYQEPGGGYVYSSGYRFMIYEPNGDVHTDPELDGTYLITNPVGLVDGAAQPVNVQTRLSVQRANRWLTAGDGTATQLSQRFVTALYDDMFQDLSGEEEVAQTFYQKYLDGVLDPYISNGRFVKKTANLYAAGEDPDVDVLADEFTGGATDDVYLIQLEKNVPQRIRMFVWVEGQDADCTNSINASSFALRLELAGSNMELS